MRQVRAIQNDTVDRICHRYYGYTAGVTEAVLTANPGLSEHGPILPLGTLMNLPEVAIQPTTATVQLWD